MIAVDTNVLARFYCVDPDDAEAMRQAPLARTIMLDSPALFVPLSVVLELEWVMRGFYRLPASSFCDAMEHLLGMPQVSVDRAAQIGSAIQLHRQGFDFADALHWVLSRHCDELVSFDDRGFARRLKKLGLMPTIRVPAAGN